MVPTWGNEFVACLVALRSSSSSSLSSSSCILSLSDDAAGEWGIFEEGPTERCTPIKIETTQGQVTLGSEKFPESGPQYTVLSVSLCLSFSLSSPSPLVTVLRTARRSEECDFLRRRGCTNC